MDKDKSAVEEFLGNLEGSKENKDPFIETPEDPFVQQTIEPEIKEKEEVKPLPFNKDPKIQKFIEKEISKRLEDFKPEPTKAEAPVDDKVSDVLTRLIGNDTPEKVSMIKEFKEILSEGTAKAKAEAIAELEARQNAEVEADREAEVELENAFENIEEAFDVDITSNNPLARKTRQEFVTFVEKIAPKDRNGDIVDYPDMTSAWETFSEIKKSTQQPNRAKELASRSMARSSEATAPKDISHLGFDNIVEHLGIQ
jgi:hypothetical protein